MARLSRYMQSQSHLGRRARTNTTSFKLQTCFVVVLFLQSSGSTITSVTALFDKPCSIQEMQNDDCQWKADTECDAGEFCSERSDCLDCDPCMAYARTSCNECLEAGCVWCPHPEANRQICTSPQLAELNPNACQIQSPGFVFDSCPTCGTSSNNVNNVLQGESCYFSLDGECDEGTWGICGSATDCFDCDACRQYDFTSCETCTSASSNCAWCPYDGLCSSADAALPAGEYRVPQTSTNVNADINWNPDNVHGITFTCRAQDWQRQPAQCKTKSTSNNLFARPPVFTDPLYKANQWVYDMIHVEPVWEAGITGAGIGIRINDEGTDVNHPDISAKFLVANSCQEYEPMSSAFTHGTVTAAIAAAAADNDACAVGIAPDASLSACRILATEPTPEIGPFSLSLNSDYSFLHEKMDDAMHISSNSYEFSVCNYKPNLRQRNRRRELRRKATCPFLSTAPPCLGTSSCAGVDWADPSGINWSCEDEIIDYCISGYNYEADAVGCTEFLDLFVDCDYIPSEEESEALIQGVTEGRGGKGIIYVFASGNSYATGERVGQKGQLKNTRLAIAVGAVGRDGLHARYSNPGTALFVSAPGGDFEHYSNYITAGGWGDLCINAGVGTSFAAPVVSGVIALMLQVNPDLTWRDVKGILALTSTYVNDSGDTSWTTNAARYSHSDYYGFGIVNAEAAVEASKTWKLFQNERMVMANSGKVDILLPDFSPESDPIISTATIGSNDAGDDFVIESINLYVQLDHPSRGDLQITLTSPSGTKSVVHPSKRPEDGKAESWKFVTHKCWGESPIGTWTLSIEDETTNGRAQRAGKLERWTVTVFGRIDSDPPSPTTDSQTETDDRLPMVELVAQTFILASAEAYLGFGEVTQEISGPGPYAVMIPWNEGFRNLGPAVSVKLQNRDWGAHLQNLLRLHVHVGDLNANELGSSQTIPTANGEDIKITIEGNPPRIKVNGVLVLGTYESKNGFAYIINDVLTPAWMSRSLADMSFPTGPLSTFASLFVRNEFEGLLNDPDDNLTIFAPDNDAFDSLSSTQYTAITSKTDIMQDTLFYHMAINGPYPSMYFASRSIPILMEGKSIQLNHNANTGVTTITGAINQATVTLKDSYLAYNGLVHGIGSVLLPYPV